MSIDYERGEAMDMMADEMDELRAELETAKALLRRWCDGFEAIDRGSLCQVYEETEDFFAKCEKEEKSDR